MIFTHQICQSRHFLNIIWVTNFEVVWHVKCSVEILNEFVCCVIVLIVINEYDFVLVWLVQIFYWFSCISLKECINDCLVLEDLVAWSDLFACALVFLLAKRTFLVKIWAFAIKFTFTTVASNFSWLTEISNLYIMICMTEYPAYCTNVEVLIKFLVTV